MTTSKTHTNPCRLLALSMLLSGCMVLLGTGNTLALNPKNESAFQGALLRLNRSVQQLNRKLTIAFTPKAGESEAGLEEIAWRMRDLQDAIAQLEKLSGEYWKNEKAIVEILNRWRDDVKVIDEAMLYAPVPKDISSLWKESKETAIVVRDYVEEVPSEEEWKKIGEAADLKILKVGRYEKKQVLREKMSAFLGGSELDKWSFPDEQKALRAEDVGEHFMVRFNVATEADTLGLPVLVRFEYKFAKHEYDGVAEETFANLKAGKHKFIFKNLGKDFINRGKIIHWRASLLLNQKVVAQKKSSMWTVVSE
jgi:hypothetical protein